MKTITVILIYIGSIVSTLAGFAPEEIHEVRAYVYDYTQEEDNKSLLKNGVLHKGVINNEGAILDNDQTQRLLKALRTKEKDQGGILCYMPHHGFVFYNKHGKAIGYIELCFQCGNRNSLPKKLSASPWDWDEMRKLLEEMKIPLFRKDKDYTKLYEEQQNK